MTKTPSNGSAVYWSHDTDGDTYDNNTALPLVGVLVYGRINDSLTQFYINFSNQERQIDVLYISFNS